MTKLGHSGAAASPSDARSQRPSAAAAAPTRSSRHQNMDALAEADAAISKDPKNADGHYARGVVLLNMGQPVLAAMAFRRALALDPTHAQSSAALAAAERPAEKLHRSLSTPPPASVWQ